MTYYEYKHVVDFSETNVVGNVYYTNHIRWQGRCREMFLREYAPTMLDELKDGLVMATLKVHCEYFQEVLAFDALSIRMSLKEHGTHRMTLGFDYWRQAENGEELIARGEQTIACMRRQGDKTDPSPWPEAFRAALEPYRG